MKNKKGFTLIEIMVTIAIIALLVALGIGVYIGLGARSRNRLFETKVGVIETAAEKWGEDFDLRDPLVITVNRLALDGYIQADEDGGKIIDPRDSEEMNCDKIEILIQDNGYVARYIGLLEGESEGEACDLMQKEIADPSIQMTAYKVTNENGIETEEDITDKIKSGELPWVNTDVRLKATYNWNTEDNPDNSAATNPLLLVKWWQNTTQLRELEERVSESNPVIENGFEHTITTPLSINTPFQISVTTLEDGVKSRRVQVKIDKISPDVPIVDAPDNWVREETEETKGNSNITIKTNDRESGIYKYEYTTSNPYASDFEESSWKELETAEEGKTLEREYEFNFFDKVNATPTDGTTNLWFRVTDVAGNTSMTGEGDETSFKYDNTAPECVYIGEGNSSATGWEKEKREILISCEDENGCKESATAQDKTIEFEKKANSLITSVAAPQPLGWHIIQDQAGNMTYCKKDLNVYIDAVKPTCGSWSGESTSWTSGNRTITGGCSDSGSGCDLKYDSGSKTFTTTVKTGSISYEVIDNVGNVGTCTKNDLNVYVDKTAPTCGPWSGQASWNSWIAGNRTISRSCIDSQSGCTTPSWAKTFTYTRNTEWASIRFYDKVGNSTDCSSNLNVFVDKTSPAVSGSFNGTSVTPYGVDNRNGFEESGIWYYEYLFTTTKGHSSGWITSNINPYIGVCGTTVTAKIRVRDKVGNVSSEVLVGTHVTNPCCIYVDSQEATNLAASLPLGSTKNDFCDTGATYYVKSGKVGVWKYNKYSDLHVPKIPSYFAEAYGPVSVYHNPIVDRRAENIMCSNDDPYLNAFGIIQDGVHDWQSGIQTDYADGAGNVRFFFVYINPTDSRYLTEYQFHDWMPPSYSNAFQIPGHSAKCVTEHTGHYWSLTP